MDDIQLLFDRGGFTMYVIAAASVVVLAVAIERLLALWGVLRNARRLSTALRASLRTQGPAASLALCVDERSALSTVFAKGIERVSQGSSAPGSVRAAVAREQKRLFANLRAGLTVLATVGSTAPFIGLFGTVLGVMRAFKRIGETGGGGFDVVSEGISEALITTAGGIAVAVVAVILYNVYQSRLGRVQMELSLVFEEFVELVEMSQRDAPSGLAEAAARPSESGGGAAC